MIVLLLKKTHQAGFTVYGWNEIARSFRTKLRSLLKLSGIYSVHASYFFCEWEFGAGNGTRAIVTSLKRFESQPKRKTWIMLHYINIKRRGWWIFKSVTNVEKKLWVIIPFLRALTASGVDSAKVIVLFSLLIYTNLKVTHLIPKPGLMRWPSAWTRFEFESTERTFPSQLSRVWWLLMNSIVINP